MTNHQHQRVLNSFPPIPTINIRIIIYNISRYSKMIIANQEIAVHLKTIRNLTGYTSGRYAIRLSFESPSPSLKIEGVPVNILERQDSKTENRSEFDERYYTSRTFVLKSGLNVELNEVCLFKVNSPIFNNGEEDFELVLVSQLLQVEQSKTKVVDTYRGRLYGLSIHEYLEMDYYEAAPCQITGSIHACNYKYEFKVNGDPIDLRSYCEKYCKFDIQDILNFLQVESVKSYKTIAQNFTLITKKQATFNLVEPEAVQKQLKRQKSKKAISLKVIEKAKQQPEIKETQQTEMDEQVIVTSPVISLGQKKKRRKIFGMVSQEGKVSKYETCERILHEYAQKIYEYWREIINVILKQQGDNFITTKAQSYRKNIKERVGQSIARFKGSWDVDIYCDEEQLRAKLAHQLRNQDKQFFKDMKADSHMFPVLNDSFFSNLRPIFFQETAKSSEALKKTVEPLQLLVIMVHGLGACRLDMEKIKVQLRRYYDKRIRIYISTSNQGRTEGDIENMGMRLATEIQYQISKYELWPTICMLGHSMGGVIIRTALPRLQKYKQCFHSLITLSSPHLGYAYSTSKLVDAGLWIMNAMKKCTSILQLTMEDNEAIQETFLYKLSKKTGLEWFKKIVLLASQQDLYVPYYSARIQKHQESSLDNRKNVKKGVIYCEMIDNMLTKCKGEITRVNINFCIPEQNLDNLIGRAAHISFINNVQMVRTFILAGPHYFF